jgi:hypothetical protein
MTPDDPGTSEFEGRLLDEVQRWLHQEATGQGADGGANFDPGGPGGLDAVISPAPETSPDPGGSEAGGGTWDWDLPDVISGDGRSLLFNDGSFSDAQTIDMDEIDLVDGGLEPGDSAGNGNLGPGNEGDIIVNDGSSVLVNDGSSVLVNDGSSVLVNDGSSVLVNDGSSVLVNDDGNSVLVNDYGSFGDAQTIDQSTGMGDGGGNAIDQVDGGPYVPDDDVDYGGYAGPGPEDGIVVH